MVSISERAMLLMPADMSPLFGLTGIAKAAIAVASMLLGFRLFLVIIPALLGWYLRSRTAAGIALALVCLLTLLFSPWAAFLPFPSDDPEVRDARSINFVLGLLWVVVLAGTVASAVRAFRSPRGQLGQRQEAWGKAIPVHVTLGISFVLWTVILCVSRAFPVEAVLAVVLVHSLAFLAALLIPQRNLLTCVSVFSLAFFLTGGCGIRPSALGGSKRCRKKRGSAWQVITSSGTIFAPRSQQVSPTCATCRLERRSAQTSCCGSTLLRPT